MYGEIGRDRRLFEHYFRHNVGIDPGECPDRVVVTPAGFEGLGAGNFRAAVEERGWSVHRVVEHPEARFGKSYLTGKHGRRILWSVGGIGAPYAFGHATLLSLVGGVKAVVFQGSAGGIGESVRSYDINVPTQAVCGAWTRKGWKPGLKPMATDSALTGRLIPALSSELRCSRRRVHSGSHYTIGHYFLETAAILNRLRESGVLTIDLEFAVYLDVLGAVGIPTAGVLRASDLPLKGIAYHDSLERKGVAEEDAREIKQGILAALLTALEQDTGG